MSDLLAKLDDLIVQATRERSHYYVASCAREARAEIERLRDFVRQVELNTREGHWNPVYHVVLKERDELRAEIKRLRAALTEIRHWRRWDE